MEATKKNVMALHWSENMALIRVEWKKKILVSKINPKLKHSLEIKIYRVQS